MKWKTHWLAGCGAAIQNMLLAAHAPGLGGVWQELYPYHWCVAKERKLLKIPGVVLATISPMIGPRELAQPRQELRLQSGFLACTLRHLLPALPGLLGRLYMMTRMFAY